MVPVSDQYVDDDVYAAMRMLTGWKIKDSTTRDHSNYQDSGEFFFYEPWHDKYEKTILGKHWGNNELAPGDIQEFFDLLAYHPGTSRHIAGKLCRRFIGPEPGQAVIDAVAASFYQNRYASDQLEQTYRTLFQSAEFKNTSNFGAILKRPMEVMVSALRVCDTEYTPAMVDDPYYWSFIYYYLQRAGQRPFYWPAPDGYPDNEEHWLGANSLLYIMRFMDWICDKDYSSDNPLVPILGTTLAASAEVLPKHSPNDLASFWLTRILGYSPEEGWTGSELHGHLSDFLTQNPNDPGLWPADTAFLDISSNSGPYYFNDRLRALVKLILSSSKFLYR